MGPSGILSVPTERSWFRLPTTMASNDEDMRMRSVSRSRSRSPATRTVFVKNLTRNIVSGHLRAVFSPYGDIRKIHMPMHQKSGQTKGSAHIEFFDAQAARTAVSHMNTGLLDGLILHLDEPVDRLLPYGGALHRHHVVGLPQEDLAEIRTVLVHSREAVAVLHTVKVKEPFEVILKVQVQVSFCFVLHPLVTQPVEVEEQIQNEEPFEVPFQHSVRFQVKEPSQEPEQDKVS
ncbi:hypothetical protein CTheo_1151 [Ceratobasidium theobromae]|uniref:RRM domain-containing protein n=1 Tax=Ceratobasidium theobromae TaxID=1582974 RepID=A0A5N5QUX2_9AGAM|nr:hypothetical protein CTheo_1151 [Ceratobasidium theobromae]